MSSRGRLPVRDRDGGAPSSRAPAAATRPRRAALCTGRRRCRCSPSGRGSAVGNVSHHVRVLADAGLLVEARELARDRRERWWAWSAGACAGRRRTSTTTQPARPPPPRRRSWGCSASSSSRGPGSTRPRTSRSGGARPCRPTLAVAHAGRAARARRGGRRGGRRGARPLARARAGARAPGPAAGATGERGAAHSRSPGGQPLIGCAHRSPPVGTGPHTADQLVVRTAARTAPPHHDLVAGHRLG